MLTTATTDLASRPRLARGSVDPAPPAPAPRRGLVAAVWTLAVAVLTRLARLLGRAHADAPVRVGPYTLEEKIGEGGMGVVYRARHSMLARPTAIKLLPAARAGAQNLARFDREVQETSRLSHPNMVAIHDYGRTPEGGAYYAMDYLDGLSLEELVALDGPQPPARVVHILRQVCGALAEAHAAGLIHRDIKPANLHLGPRRGNADHVTVLDFGLVKNLEAAAPVRSVTEDGCFLGTPHYVSPEMITCPEQVDGRADLYALGAVAYFLLTGTPPVTGRTLPEILGAHLYRTPERPGARLGQDLPAALEELVLACLAKAPEARPGSAAALADALAGCAGVGRWSEDDARRWWSAHPTTGETPATPSELLGTEIRIQLAA